MSDADNDWVHVEFMSDAELRLECLKIARDQFGNYRNDNGEYCPAPTDDILDAAILYADFVLHEELEDE